MKDSREHPDEIPLTTFTRPKYLFIFSVCNKGYYKASDTTCTECSKGNYKDALSDATSCTACPSGSETTGTASTSSSDCRTYKNAFLLPIEVGRWLSFSELMIRGFCKFFLT